MKELQKVLNKKNRVVRSLSILCVDKDRSAK